mmetsp:Transcript_11065/g.17050  ORF Transcript_11065/g.17050 Transcript_11065/m.17050 type:complete len:84 (+) Transcript_11065:4322-4573(+)
MLNFSDLIVAEQMRPLNMPPITVINDMNRAFQSKDFTTLSENDVVAYRTKLTGSIMIESKVDMVVIVTESARSALNIEHHQFE